MERHCERSFGQTLAEQFEIRLCKSIPGAVLKMKSSKSQTLSDHLILSEPQLEKWL